MPIIVTKNSTDYYLVPSPLVSFNRTTYNNPGRNGFGATYDITLEGTLVPEKGNPYYDMTDGSTQPGRAIMAPDTDAWTKPSRGEAGADNEPNKGNNPDYLLAATLRKQEAIRTLFSTPVVNGSGTPIVLNITNWGEETKGYKLAAFVDSVSFGSEGRGALPTTYTISLRASNFLESSNEDFGVYNNEYGAKWQVESVSESFEIAEYDTFNVVFNGNGINGDYEKTEKLYLVNKSTDVVGSPVYDADGAYISGYAPWQQASGFVYDYLGLGTGTVPNSRFDLTFGSHAYQAADRIISETIDKEAGSYSIQENYILYTGNPVVHTVSINTDFEQNERRSVTIDGTIQGLSTSDPLTNQRNNYDNALSFYNLQNPNPNSGIRSDTYVIPSAYFWARSVSQLDWLHPVPVSKSFGRDLSAGSLTYNFSFNDRPPALVSGSVSESVTVNDTYPGEIFSATPVIGRNQPILQYLNSRSEYKRALNINIVMGEDPVKEWDLSGIAANNNGYWAEPSRANLQHLFTNSKPSNISMASGDLSAIFDAVNPVNDANFSVRSGKCFHSAPTENWDAYSRTYTYNIEWTYERDI